MTEEPTLRDQIRRVLSEHARLVVAIGTLDDQDNLFGAGMASHASVNVMLAPEDTFDVESPVAMLMKATFQSVAAIEAALSELRSGSA
jgi:acyl carrier protein